MEDIEKIKLFSFDLWQKWIKERCYGLDTLTTINLHRDPNPHHALIEAYNELFVKNQRELFVEALLSFINEIIDACFNDIKTKKNIEYKQDEYLALERAITVLNRLDTNDIPSRAKAIVRKCSHVIPILNSEISTGNLHRLSLMIRNNIGDTISNAEILEAIKAQETFIVAFQIACKQNHLLAIGKYFSVFLKTAIESGQKTLIKTETFRLLKEYGKNSYEANSIIQEIRSSLSQIPEDIFDLIESACSSFNLQFIGTIPIMKVIESRKQAEKAKNILISVNDNYVGGKAYTNFVTDVLDNLAIITNSTIQTYPKGGARWDLTASFLAINQFDFCCDPYFKTISRSYLVDVVPFGHLKTFTAIVPNTASILRSPLTDTGLSFENRLFEFLKNSNSTPKEIVGILGETPSSAEVLNAIGPSSYYRDRIFNGASIIQLRSWLSEFPKSRIIICDIGVARDINELKYEDMKSPHFFLDKSKFDEKSTSGIEENTLIFDYKRPIQSGFIYPIADGQWYCIILDAVRNTLKNSFPEINWKIISDELVKIGVIPYSDDEFYFKLLALHEDPVFCKKYKEELIKLEKFEEIGIFEKNWLSK